MNDDMIEVAVDKETATYLNKIAQKFGITVKEAVAKILSNEKDKSKVRPRTVVEKE